MPKQPIRAFRHRPVAHQAVRSDTSSRDSRRIRRGPALFCKIGVATALFAVGAGACVAQVGSTAPPIAALRTTNAATTTITPIFSQLLAMSLPTGFVVANERHDNRTYLRESVLKGETVDNWSQMITVIGKKDLAANPQATPEAVAEMAGGIYARACPGTLTAKSLGPTKIDGNDAFMAFFGCGSVDGAAGAHAESVLVLAVNGSRDGYIIQWAQRGPASSAPLAFDKAQWMRRLNRLAPIKLCPIKPGEPAPYPSCIDHKVAEHFP